MSQMSLTTLQERFDGTICSVGWYICRNGWRPWLDDLSSGFDRIPGERPLRHHYRCKNISVF